MFHRICALFCTIASIVAIQSVANLGNLCPVSFEPHFRSNGDHHYPIEIYHPSRLIYSGVQDPVETCQTMDRGKMRNYTCAEVKPFGCPLISDNVFHGLNASTHWKKSTSLCKLKGALQDSSKNITFIAFGGSVTFGEAAMGCCNSSTCFGMEGRNRCAWPHYLEKWMRATNRASVRVVNAAFGGTTSEISGERLESILELFGVKELTEDSVVFVDHSYNDKTLCHTTESSALRRGLEKLVRRLLTLSSPPPTIVLMETDTKHTGCFSPVYRELAQYYGLHLYSYTDAVLHNSSAVHQKYHHHHLTSVARGVSHPAWHTHLIYADFIAALLSHELNQCHGFSTSVLAAAPFVLPPPLTTVDDSAHCSSQYPPLLKVTYDLLKANRSIGMVTIPLPGTWQVRLDKRERGGLIAELTPQSDLGAMQGAAIEFTLNMTVAELRGSKSDVVLQLMYMRSYENSGQFSVQLCGRPIHDLLLPLDTLWEDYKTYHYSIPALRSVRLNRKGCDHLTEGEKVTLAAHYIVDGDIILDVGTIIAKRPRGTQLVKLESVLVCKY